MQNWKRRAIGYVVFVSIALVLTAIGYQWGMRVYEGRPRTFLASLQFAVEMFTTTGFGGDSPWTSSEMNAFITLADLAGMIILVGALPVFVGPLVERTLSSQAPKQLDSPLEDHVVICSDTTRAEELIEELDTNAVPYVIVEPDTERANSLYEEGHRTIRADPESTAGLAAAGLSSARAVFADVSDKVDASIVLAAKELAEDVPVISVVEDPDTIPYHRLAGADHVLSPRSLLGEALAAKVTTALRMEVDEAVSIGDQFQLVEVSIRHGSRLAGSTIANSGIREESGANIIGAWIRGEFKTPPSPDLRLPAGSVLLASGSADQLERLVEKTQSELREFEVDETIVIGYGQVGRTVGDELDDAGISYTVVDQAEKDGVDVVGDAIDPETLRAAGIQDAGTVILALPEDTTTEFATLVIRDIAPHTQIITRVEERSNISKTYRAGSDYVLSLSRITGRMAASHLLRNREVLSPNRQVEIIRERVPALAGETIRDAEIRERTGCTVIAIERGDEVLTSIGPDTRIGVDDELVIVGTDDGIREFDQTFR